jgi:tryptophan 2,3-dioxygenase
MSHRELEDTIVTDLEGRETYADYLRLDLLLAAQQPVSQHHDELLFIVQHQTSELWMKLMIHELEAIRLAVQADQLDSSFKMFARIAAIQAQLFSQWSVLETLTPSEYAEFRASLGTASGFQSPQYRAVEFLLGNKDRNSLLPHQHDQVAHAMLTQHLNAPSIYDEFLRLLKRRGADIPERLVERDWSLPYEPDPEVTLVFRHIYEQPSKYWDEYEMCEKLVDVEERFQLWRFRHMMTVQRIIGFKRGTGGSSGVGFLRKALDQSFFPELWDVRTELREAPPVTGA